MANERVAEIAAAMERELSPELVELLSDLPITEVPEGLEDEPEVEVEPYDPDHPDNPAGTDLDCSTLEDENGHGSAGDTDGAEDDDDDAGHEGDEEGDT